VAWPIKGGIPKLIVLEIRVESGVIWTGGKSGSGAPDYLVVGASAALGVGGKRSEVSPGPEGTDSSRCFWLKQETGPDRILPRRLTERRKSVATIWTWIDVVAWGKSQSFVRLPAED